MKVLRSCVWNEHFSEVLLPMCYTTTQEEQAACQGTDPQRVPSLSIPERGSYSAQLLWQQGYTCPRHPLP